MRTLIYWPPLGKISGGMRVLVQLANQLAKTGHDTSLVISETITPTFGLAETIKLISFNEMNLSARDRWIIPEGWPNALAPGLKAGCQCGVFVQNWMPFHEILPDGVFWRSLPVSMLAISHPVMHFIKETTGMDSRIIPPAIDHKIFYSTSMEKLYCPKRLVRIAYMPRKNRAIITQIKAITEARSNLNQSAWYPRLQWDEIHNQPPVKVGTLLRNADIFLSAGFPEGFGLPPLEAMACGCLVAGFTGMGGWEYMRQASPCGAASPFPLQKTAWGANGFFAADGDVWGAAICLEQAIKALLTGGAILEELHANEQKASQWYSQERQGEAITKIWNDKFFWINAKK